MKPTKRTAKKVTAKKRPTKRAGVRCSVEHKMLQLYNRIDGWSNFGERAETIVTPQDKKWVWTLIEDIQNKMFTKLCKEDWLKCNGLWRQYA